jgi:small subunit ribosomal protein S18
MTETTQTQETARIRHFDYKDVEALKKYLNPHGRIIGRKHSKLNALEQRMLARAVKYARFMGFIPYVAR